MEIEINCRICKKPVKINVYWVEKDNPPKLDVVCWKCGGNEPKAKGESYKSKDTGRKKPVVS